ncbi:hypothetical protein [Sulfurimonas sp.]|nr:hypothetical protein [Sulfurimonas sp.]
MKNNNIQKSVLFDDSVADIKCFNKQTNIVHNKKHINNKEVTKK